MQIWSFKIQRFLAPDREADKHQISDTRYVQTVVKSMSDGAVSGGAGGGGAVGDVVDDGVMNDFIIKSLRFLGADVSF